LRKASAIALIFVLVVASYEIISLTMTEGRTSEDRGFYIKSTSTFMNEGTDVWNLTQEDRSWALFMNNSWQTVRLIGHGHPLEAITTDADGNKLAVSQFQSRLHSGDSVDDYVVYHVLLKPRSIPNLSYAESGTLTQIPNIVQTQYCGRYGFWMTDDPKIQETALAITGGETNVLAVVAKLVSWIWNNIKYKSHDPTLYPNETLSLREGDCDEQAMLLGTFCRVLGIPSYLQIGCVFQPETNSSSDSGRMHYTLNDIAWHGWAIVYVPPWGWLPADLTYVSGSRTDPLNAVKTGAVMLQSTVQAMNISQNDYIASDRVWKGLLESNNFTVYSTDKMSLTGAVFGDLSRDNVVNVVDLLIAAQAFGSTPNGANWNEAADLNKDGNVDILDLSIVATRFGRTD
jgi:transglutaminase-like putative cysteine protease